MTRIKRIEIMNFQSHEMSVIDLDDGLNVITGPSDQGKSAIIRALRWVLYNEPRGSDFIRHKQNKCQVAVGFDNGFKVTRKRTPSQNRYILLSPEGQEYIFERVGSGVPEEIVEIHGMKKVELDTDNESTLNIDYQLEGAFLLTDSGSVRAKTLGRLINVHMVDSAIRRAKTDISRLNLKEKQLEEELEINKTKLEDFADLDDLKDSIENKNLILSKLKNNLREVKKLRGLNERLNNINQKLLKFSKVKESLAHLADLKSLYDSILAKDKRLNEIDIIYNKYSIIQEKSKRLKEVLDQISELNQANSHYNNLVNLDQRYHLAQKLLDKYKDNLNRITLGRKIIKELAKIEDVNAIVKLSSKQQLKYNNLKEINVKWDKLQNNLMDNKKIVNETKEISMVKDLITTKIPKIEAKIDQLDNYKEAFDRLDLLMKEQEERLNILPKDEQIVYITDKLNLNSKKLEELEKLEKDLQSNHRSIDKGKKYILDNNKRIEKLAQEYGDLLKSIGKCPTCLESIEDNTIDKIISELKGD